MKTLIMMTSISYSFSRSIAYGSCVIRRIFCEKLIIEVIDMGNLSRISHLLLVVIGFSVISVSSYADPANGNGRGQNKGYQEDKPNKWHNKSQNNHFDNETLLSISLSYNEARAIALDGGFTGYSSLPPGIAKNLVRGKPLPPGIAKKMVPEKMLSQLPYYPGYEWRIAGNDLVLITLSTAIVISIINNVFD